MEGKSPASPHLKFPVIWAERDRKKEKAMRRRGRVKREVSIFCVLPENSLLIWILFSGIKRTMKRVDREKTFGV